MVQSALKAFDKFSAESRARAARLSEWLTLGAGVPGYIHSDGSPDGAKLIIRSLSAVDKYADYAREIAGITEEIPELGKKKK